MVYTGDALKKFTYSLFQGYRSVIVSAGSSQRRKVRIGARFGRTGLADGALGDDYAR